METKDNKIMRNPLVVLKQIYDAVPEDQEDMRNSLNKLVEDFIYKAPEQVGECFYLLTMAVNRYIPYPAIEDWHFEVASILTTKSIEELKQEALNLVNKE